MSRHLGLVVEDDLAMAENLLEIVSSLDCDGISADNRQTAIALLDQHSFCFVLLDLQIKAEPSSIKGHTAHGHAVLREIRQRCGPNRGVPFWTPVLVVSGYAEEVDDVIDMMRNKADDIIRKPPDTEDVSRRIRAALQQAGRELHPQCCTIAGTVSAAPGILITFQGIRDGRRTVVQIAGQDVSLPDSSLKLLLQLAIASEKKEFVHQRALGARSDHGFKGISRLGQEIQPALGKGVKIIDNDHHGGYALRSDVRIVECDPRNLRSIGNAEIDRLAEVLSGLISARQD